MEDNVSAVLLLGVAVQYEDFNTRVKAFDHKRPKTENFCAKTGKALWITENSLAEKATACGLSVATAAPYVGGAQYLGIQLAETGAYGQTAFCHLSPEEYAAKFAEAKEKLIAFGIKKPDVAIWSVVSCS